MMARLSFIALGCLLSSATGCEKPLFVENQPRTPYERYQILRGQNRPTTEENEFGGQQPALRDRLKPLNEP